MDPMKKINETLESYYEIMDSIPVVGSKNVSARNIISRLATLLEQDLPEIFKKATCLASDECLSDSYKLCKLRCGGNIMFLQSDNASAVLKTKHNVASIRVNGEGIKISTAGDFSVTLGRSEISLKLPGSEKSVNYTIPLTVDDINENREVIEYVLTRVMKYVSTIKRLEGSCTKELRLAC